MPPKSLPFTDDADANRLLATDPLALLIGMLLDQQFPMERAFLSPKLLADRLGGSLDAGAIATMDSEELVAVFRGPPALHRFPGSMAQRTQALCGHLDEHYDGEAGSVWRTAADGHDLYRRLKALPGFGEAKARIFVAVVGRRLGEGPEGWEETAADWPSIADVEAFDQVFVLREQKREAKRRAKEKG
jgi:uncharacterized HhH-GPD family protein